MVMLMDSLLSWGNDHFQDVFKEELVNRVSHDILLAKCAAVSGYFKDDITVMILSVNDMPHDIEICLALLFTEVEPAYCCPMIAVEHNGICEMKVKINKETAWMTIDPL